MDVKYYFCSYYSQNNIWTFVSDNSNQKEKKSFKGKKQKQLRKCICQTSSLSFVPSSSLFSSLGEESSSSFSPSSSDEA